MAKGSGGALQLPQRVRTEPGRQMHFGAIRSQKFPTLLKFYHVHKTSMQHFLSLHTVVWGILSLLCVSVFVSLFVRLQISQRLKSYSREILHAC